VQKIRGALRDSPESPRYIETIPRVGYRFIAPVAEVAAVGPMRTDEVASAESGSDSFAGRSFAARSSAAPGVKRTRMWAFVAGCAAMVIVAGVWLARRKATVAPIRSLAVLPLENLSGDPSQQYFADGMTDELTTMLVRDSTLRIISRTSVMQYRGVHKPLPEIARALNVDSIVEGSVSRSGDQMHMTLQLIRAEPEAHLWAESYDRATNDVAALPDEAARAIASRLNSASPRRTARYVNTEAYDADLAAALLFNHWDGAGALKEITRATELDPQSWEAYHLHAKILCALGRNDEAIAIQKQSTAINPFVHPGAMAEIYLCTRHFEEAIRDGRMRLADFPVAADILDDLAYSYHWMGKDKEATEMLARELAAEGDPSLAAAVRRAFASGGYPAVVRVRLAAQEKKAQTTRVSTFILGELHGMLGEREKTLALLEQGVSERDPLLTFQMQADPAFDFLHGEPRYRALVQQMNLAR